MNFSEETKAPDGDEVSVILQSLLSYFKANPSAQKLKAIDFEKVMQRINAKFDLRLFQLYHIHLYSIG
jgi:hypothetical protein